MKKIVTLMLIVLMTMLTGCGTEQKSDTVSSEKPKEVSNMELKPSESYVSNEDKKHKQINMTSQLSEMLRSQGLTLLH